MPPATTFTGGADGRSVVASKPRTNWSAINEKLWTRSGGACEKCGVGLADVGAGERHHRKLRSGGGKDDCANVVLLCTSCHTAGPQAVHRRVADALRDGMIVSKYRDPAAVPIQLALHGWATLNSDGTFTPSLFGPEDELLEAA